MYRTPILPNRNSNINTPPSQSGGDFSASDAHGDGRGFVRNSRIRIRRPIGAKPRRAGFITIRPYFDAGATGAPSASGREWYGRVEIAGDGSYAKLTKDAAYVDLDGGGIVERGDMVSPGDYLPSGGGEQSASIGVAAHVESAKRGTVRANVGKRGNVTTFSRKSRKRLLNEFAQFDKRQVATDAVVLLTLTYADAPDPREAKADLEAMRRRLERRYPHMSAVWRLELQPERSKREGVPVIHYHLMVFGLKRGRNMSDAMLKAELLSWMPAAWTAISGAPSQGCDIRVESSWRRVFSYLAKYVAKVADDAENMPALPEGMGRHWGRFRRDLLPWSVRWVGYVSSMAQKRMAGHFRFLAGIPDDAAYALPSISAYVWDIHEFLDWCAGNGVRILWTEGGGRYGPAGGG